MFVLFAINKYRKDDMMHGISGGKIKNYENVKYGDLYDVWTRIQKECLSCE